ncbi:MAG: hypothetical protein IAG13_22005 [Deltaproteobacteria bacterium]|nr:hypothetical protein [Nannocystaceae bacterium]
MLRPPFPGHRRYSITHRAVQRLRELVPKRDDEDDETLRDRLDAALAAAEADGKAVRTLDAMLGEPQTLIPIVDFGDTLYAIIKEETVVTVLPQGHGEEILQRGQAMEQRVAAGHVAVRPTDRDRPAGPSIEFDRARHWRSRESAPAPVIIEKTPRSGASLDDAPPAAPAAPRPDAPRLADLAVSAKVVALPERPKLEGPVGEALRDALDRGKRRAAIAALREVLSTSHRDTSLLPLWNELAKHEIPQTLTVGDLLEALRGL